jgi:glycosyltransferase involved in cell wall biosynthesis
MRSYNFKTTEIVRGVTVIVCCYNSSTRLPSVLTHLAAQEVPGDIPWEVIVVDNASTDDTSQVALHVWPKDLPVPLNVLYEPELGLIHARHRGFSEARYELVSFIDDDNWVASDWVKVVFEVMSQRPTIGACGGLAEAVCEIEPPWWFEKYKSHYAAGSQGPIGGDVTETRGYLWGAGLTIRKSVWQELIKSGFRSLLTGRRGNNLTAGEDSELCFAMRIAGWRLWYEPCLHLRHFLPAQRLTWRYFRLLFRGFGASTVGHDPYRVLLRSEGKTHQETWKQEFSKTLMKLLRFRGRLGKAILTSCEGDHQALAVEFTMGRFFELFHRRQAYDRSFHDVRELKDNLDVKGRDCLKPIKRT